MHRIHVSIMRRSWGEDRYFLTIRDHKRAYLFLSSLWTQLYYSEADYPIVDSTSHWFLLIFPLAPSLMDNTLLISNPTQSGAGEIKSAETQSVLLLVSSSHWRGYGNCSLTWGFWVMSRCQLSMYLSLPWIIESWSHCCRRTGWAEFLHH